MIQSLFYVMIIDDQVKAFFFLVPLDLDLFIYLFFIYFY